MPQCRRPQWPTQCRVATRRYVHSVDPTPRFHTTVRLVDSRTVVVKIARGRDRNLLRHEAHTLAGLHHHGVVKLVATGGDDERFGLATVHTGIHNLHTIPAPSVVEAATVCIQVFDVISHLHRSGVTHGRIGAEHVIVGWHHQIQLCGFRSARMYDPVGAASDVEHSAAVCAALMHTAVRTLPRRNRRRHAALASVCLSLLNDPGLGAAAMTQRLRAAVDTAIATPAVSVQAQRHLIGQQPAANGQHQPVPVLGHQTIEHPVQVVRP